MKGPNNVAKDFIPALGYHWLTDLYDLAIKLTMPEKKFRSKLVNLLEPEARDEILEFGFGTGQNLVAIFQRNMATQVQGLDIDPKVQAIAERKLNDIGAKMQLDLYDGGQFPYADGSFNKAFSSLVFHQLDGPTKQHCLNELFRVLKPGGTLLIADWGEAKNRLMRLAFYLVQLLDGFKTTNDNVIGLMPEFIMKAGFREVSEEAYINTRLGTFSYYLAIKPND